MTCKTENALFLSEHMIQNRESMSRVHVCESGAHSSTNRWVGSFATYAYSCCICLPEFFIVLRP